MRLARVLVVTVGLGFGLACAGLPMATPEVEPAVQELLDAEQGDGAALEGDALTARVLVLQAFLAATTDFADWKAATFDCLAGDCADTTEAAYAKVRTDFAPHPGDPVTVGPDPWRVLVVVEHTWDPSEEWTTASAEVPNAALVVHDVVTTEAGPGVTSIPANREDGTPATVIDFASLVPEKEPKVGYVFAKNGADPVFHDAGPAEEVRAAACAYFAIPCELDGGEAAAEPAPAEPEPAAEEPSKAKAGGKAKAWQPGSR